MRIWFDTEFIEDGRTIDLISIGAVREDGLKFYAELPPGEIPWWRADPWVIDNVLPHLNGPTMPKADLTARLVEFAGPEPEWWAYYADYDWVVLCQLFGRMIDLPPGWPMYCRDVKQLADERRVNLSNIPQGTEHHALADAEWARIAWRLVHEETP